MSDFKPTYAPLPLRALADPALSGAEIRVLGAIAAHDRFARNRTGCFASYQRLAQIAGLTIDSVKRSAAKLADLGYLRSEKNPMDARRRVLFVEYNDDDAAAMRGDGRSFTKRSRLKLAPTIGGDMDTDSKGASRPARSRSKVGIGGHMDTETPNREHDRERVPDRLIGGQMDTDCAEIGVHEKKQLAENIERSGTNILCEAYNRSRETLLGKENEREATAQIIAEAERVASDAISGRICVDDAIDRLRRTAGRLRSYGDEAGERRARAMIETVAADAPKREKRAERGLFASPMELAAIREARERGEPVPAWVRPEVRGAA